MFSTRLESFLLFSPNLKLSSSNFSIWKSLKFVVWERVNDPEWVFENIMVKGKYGNNQHFLLFPIISTLPKASLKSLVAYILLSANAFDLDQTKLMWFGRINIAAKIYVREIVCQYCWTCRKGLFKVSLNSQYYFVIFIVLQYWYCLHSNNRRARPTIQYRHRSQPIIVNHYLGRSFCPRCINPDLFFVFWSPCSVKTGFNSLWILCRSGSDCRKYAVRGFFQTWLWTWNDYL